MLAKMNNYKILFSLRILKNILNNFIDVFFVLYFLTVSNSNILSLGIYKLIAIIAIYFVILLSRNFCKSDKRIYLLRIGIILYFFYFWAIIFLKEKIVDYMYFIGLLYGLEEGFYYSVFNMLETDGVENKERAKYVGSQTCVQNIISILFPLIFGSLTRINGFIETTLIALLIVVIEIILSHMFQDKNIPKNKKTHLKKFFEMMKGNNIYKNIAFNNICMGLTYSEGALSYVVTIYIIRVFNESLSLGIFTSIFSLISAFLGFLFIKVIKPKQYKKLMICTSVLSILCFSIMLIYCNFLSIIFYKLFYTISNGLQDLVNGKNIGNFSNIEEIQKEYKVEYYLSMETFLFIGRVISNVLFIFMAFTNTEIIMALFVIFVLLRDISSISLQNSIIQNQRKI